MVVGMIITATQCILLTVILCAILPLHLPHHHACLTSQDRTRVQFTVGDACNLPQLGQFGCVFAGNLICRLPEPMKFFERLSDLIVPGGILVITSPYTWLEQYTPKVPATLCTSVLFGFFMHHKPFFQRYIFPFF